MSSKWSQHNIPNLAGKIIVITGANSGLGLESSRILASKGATVVMTARNMTKGQAAFDDIMQDQPTASLDLMQLDVGDLDAVQAFADAFKAKYDRLDILLNNAGVMAIPRQETVDGFEMQLGINHLGHFALTGHLLDIITQTPNARIHNVSSSAHYMGKINFDDLMSEKSYSRWAAYGQSKLANVYFSNELHNRLRGAGYNTIVNSSHPGLVMGNLQTKSVEQSGSNLESILYRTIAPLIAQDVTMGVLPMLYAMTAPEAKSGVFYGPDFLNMRGYPAEQQINKEAQDTDKLRRFFDLSEQLTNVTYSL